MPLTYNVNVIMKRCLLLKMIINFIVSNLQLSVSQYSARQNDFADLQMLEISFKLISINERIIIASASKTNNLQRL